jgi:hypothetical protein
MVNLPEHAVESNAKTIGGAWGSFSYQQ